MIGLIEMCFDNVLKGNPLSFVGQINRPHKRGPLAFLRVSWLNCVGSSSLHLPALGVRTAWNRGGHSDRLLWGSLVNSY